MTQDFRSIVCKNCETRYKVPVTMTAHKTTCRKCGSPIFLSTQTGTKRRTTTRRAYTRVRGNHAPKKATPLQIASGVICLVILGAFVFLVVKT